MTEYSVYPVLTRDGTVQLWAHGWNSPRCTVTRGARSAVLHGSELVVTLTNGSTTVYRLTPGGSNAYPTRCIS
jgi:hypothetical protein